MSRQITLDHFIAFLCRQGYDYDAIALALAGGAVDALITSGASGALLDDKILSIVETMWARAAHSRGFVHPGAEVTISRKRSASLAMQMGAKP